MFFINSNRRAFWRGAFALLVMFFLSAALLFTGCDSDTKDDTVTVPSGLVGQWKDATSGDFYDITSTKLFYDNNYGSVVGGTVRYYEDFDAASGVIIFEYDAGSESSDAAEYGKFQALYYVELNSSQFKGGNAWDSQGTGEWGGPAEQKTLAAAKAAFTKANKDRYLGYVGGPYVKQ